MKTLEKPRTSNTPQVETYIHRVEPSHLTRRTVLGVLTRTEPMPMTDAMINALLIAQLGRFRLFALARLWCVASCTPWGDGVEKPTWRGHLALPVNRPEEVEARQCERLVITIGEVLDRSSCKYVRRASMWLLGHVDSDWRIIAASAVGDISAAPVPNRPTAEISMSKERNYRWGIEVNIASRQCLVSFLGWARATSLS